MLQPKRTKFRKMQKGRMKGNAGRGNQIAFGSFAIKTLEEAWSIQSQLGPSPTQYAILLSLARAVDEALEQGDWTESDFEPTIREFGFKNLDDLFSRVFLFFGFLRLHIQTLTQ